LKHNHYAGGLEEKMKNASIRMKETTPSFAAFINALKGSKASRVKIVNER